MCMCAHVHVCAGVCGVRACVWGVCVCVHVCRTYGAPFVSKLLMLFGLLFHHAMKLLLRAIKSSLRAIKSLLRVIKPLAMCFTSRDKIIAPSDEVIALSDEFTSSNNVYCMRGVFLKLLAQPAFMSFLESVEVKGHVHIQ